MSATMSERGPQPPDATAVTAEGELLPPDPQRIRYEDLAVPTGAPVAVAPGLAWARIPLPIDLNHINIWLADAGDGYIVVDTGMSASVCMEAWERLERIAFAHKPLKSIFVTHIHPDHIGLAAWLQTRHGVPVTLSARAVQVARAIFSGAALGPGEAEKYLRLHGVPDASQLQSLIKPERFARMTSGLPRVDTLIEDGSSLQWGGSRWSALQTDGHAEGHLCLWNDRDAVLISGDQVLPTISSNISLMPGFGDSNPLQSYLSSLRRLRTLPAAALVLPSHGLPFRGLHARIDELQRHHDVQLERLLAACVRPFTAFELLPVLFRRELVGMHLFLALGEAIAHLEYLVDAGRMEAATADGTRKYVAVSGARAG